MQRWVAPTVLICVSLLSLALLGYGAWLLQLERGGRALGRGELDAAAGIYAAAERPFVRVRLLGRLFPDHFSRAVFPQVALLYTRDKIDEAIGKLEQAATAAPALAERAEYAFWSGNVLLRRALRNSDPDAIMKNLNAAAAQYQKGLETAPDDWDLKYNYELVQHILAQHDRDRKKEEGRIKSILERIRTVTDPAEKELPPPEKRG